MSIYCEERERDEESEYFNRLQQAPPRVGVLPYIVRPIKCGETFIFYVNILFPCPLLTRRAWLHTPNEVGDRATVMLETTAMNLGQRGDAPRVKIESIYAGKGSAINRETPLVFRMESVHGSFVYGEAENRHGVLTATSSKRQKTDIVNPQNFFLKTPRLASVIDTGVKCVVQSGEAQQLRAIASDRAAPFCFYRPESIERRFGSEFYLAWRPAASTEGFPVSFTLVAEDRCVCDLRTPQTIFSRQSSTVLAGPEWEF